MISLKINNNNYMKTLILTIPVILILVMPNVLNAKSMQVEKNKGNNIIKVAMLQMNPDGFNIQNNLKKGETFCREAKRKGADIALFPEIWSIGYSRYNWQGSEKYTPEKYPLSFDEWKRTALDHKSSFIRHFQNLAKELEMAIAITYLEKWDDLPRNSVSLIDANGKILMTYAKVHTSDMKLTESNCTPGDDFYVCDLSVGEETVKVGAMICFDREFPESARILMLKGAELVLTPNACGLDDKRINQFQTRAFDNAFAVVMTNYASPTQNGRSCAFNANGDEVIVAGKKEGVYVAEFDLDKIRAHRKKTIWGNAYRRTNKYNSLTSHEVDSVFIRKNDVGKTFDRTQR
jgi:predicted amidohydrolase